MLTCGLLRSNFSFAMVLAPLVSPAVDQSPYSVGGGRGFPAVPFMQIWTESLPEVVSGQVSLRSGRTAWNRTARSIDHQHWWSNRLLASAEIPIAIALPRGRPRPWGRLRAVRSDHDDTTCVLPDVTSTLDGDCPAHAFACSHTGRVSNARTEEFGKWAW
jgi:hypothetical protein